MKPSERVPGAGTMLINLMIEAGLPAGCLGVVHGQHDAVNFVCDNKHIRGYIFNFTEKNNCIFKKFIQKKLKAINIFIIFLMIEHLKGRLFL